MGKHDTTRAAINATPTKKNIKFSAVNALLIADGATCKVTGSHYIYRKEGRDPLSLKRRDELLPYQVKQVRDFL